jgi:hypothetical protein
MCTRAARGEADRRNPEHGAALMVALVTIVGLMAIGAVTLLAVQSEISSGGASRFEQTALYSAESGAAAGMEYLRTNCRETNLFSDLVEPDNVNPQRPGAILGNDKQPGQAGNVFPVDSGAWYNVTILNNLGDTGYAVGDDMDGTVVLRSIGHGPNATQVTIELTVRNAGCIAQYCEQEFAQRNIGARNDANAVCSGAINPTGGTRVINPGGVGGP